MTAAYFGDDFRPGMVQKAIWHDLTGDGKEELVLAGEWMPVRVYRQQQDGKFKESEPLAENGWYYGLVPFQSSSGDRGLLLGNLGLNSKLRADESRPVKLYHGDFDSNGQDDPLIFHYMEGLLVPFATRDDLIRQIPGLKRKHDSYVQYAGLTSPQGLLDREQLKRASISEAKELRSLYVPLGTGPRMALPMEAQFSPLRDFVAFESGGESYVLGLGNFSGFRADFGRKMAQPLVLMKWTGEGFVHVPLGLDAHTYWGEYRYVHKITIQGQKHLIAVRNNDTPLVLRILP